jgi:hypothetical protein
MSKQKPEQCPLCHQEWISTKTGIPGAEYVADCCELRLIVNNSKAWFIVKKLTNECEIWWCSIINHTWCEIKISSSVNYKRINFIPPFNIDENRLKKLLLFS